MDIELHRKMKYAEINNDYEKELNIITTYNVGGVGIVFNNGYDIVMKFTYLKEYLEDEQLDMVMLRDINNNQFDVSTLDFLTLRYEMIERGIVLQTKKSSLYSTIDGATTIDEILAITWEN